MYRKWFINDVTFALTALKTGHPDEALASARDAHEALIGTLGEKHYPSAEAAGVLGMALAVAGQRAEAMELFGRAIPILLARSRRTDDDSGGAAALALRRRLILESYRLDHLGKVGCKGRERTLFVLTHQPGISDYIGN